MFCCRRRSCWNSFNVADCGSLALRGYQKAQFLVVCLLWRWCMVGEFQKAGESTFFYRSDCKKLCGRILAALWFFFGYWSSVMVPGLQVVCIQDFRTAIKKTRRVAFWFMCEKVGGKAFRGLLVGVVFKARFSEWKCQMVGLRLFKRHGILGWEMRVSVMNSKFIKKGVASLSLVFRRWGNLAWFGIVITFGRLRISRDERPWLAACWFAFH